MGRTIITDRDLRPAQEQGRGTPRRERRALRGPTATGDVVDNYFGRLAKYIPGETIGLYLALEGLVRTAEDDAGVAAWLWAVFAIGLVFTPLYLRYVAGVWKRSQVAASTASYVVWVFALDGAFATLGFYRPWMGSFVLVVFTAFLPIFTARR